MTVVVHGGGTGCRLGAFDAHGGLCARAVAAAAQGDTLADSLLERGAGQCERLLAVAPATLPIHLVGGLADICRPRLRPATRARLATPRGDAFSGLHALSRDARGSGA